MFLWFAGTSFLAVWLIFRSPAVDYRLVVIGALLPLLELVFGHPKVLHSVVGAAALFMLCVVASPRRRLAQRRLVAIPIGVFLHQVFDGAWMSTKAFWWPLSGLGWSDAELPELSRGLGLNLVLELAGGVALWWCWQRFRLGEPERRATFLRTGQLGRDLVSAPPHE